MKHRKDKNGYVNESELISILAFCAAIALCICLFVWMGKVKKGRIETDQTAKTDAQRYAMENGLPLGITIERIRGCQYLESGRGGYAFSRTHMGNCDNPIHPYNAVPKSQTQLEQ